jgi:hypothetical protein
LAKRPGAEGPAIPQIKESDLSDENHPAYVAPMTVQHDSTSPVELEAAPMGVVYPAARWPGALAPAATAPVQQQRKAAIDFKKNQAIKFVNKIKTHFAKDSDVYKQFLEIMQVPARPQTPAPRSSVLSVAYSTRSSGVGGGARGGSSLSGCFAGSYTHVYAHVDVAGRLPSAFAKHCAAAADVLEG